MAVWRMAMRSKTDGYEMWPACRDAGIASITYLPVKDVDLSKHPNETTFGKFKELFGSQQKSMERFVCEFQEKDIIYVKQGDKIVGRGIVTGPYNFDHDERIREPNGVSWRHQRTVNWSESFPEMTIQLGNAQQFTIEPLTQDEVFTIESAIKGSLDADEADDGAYVAPDINDPIKVLQQIKLRRGQQKFREALLKRYNRTCMITGCNVVHVLEAAHIDPYQCEGHNHPANGLLLRADIHTLFDLDYLAIDPIMMKVSCHPNIIDYYREYAGKELLVGSSTGPDKEALRQRYEKFLSKVAGSG